MPSTLKYQITYPAGNVAPNVPLAMQSQAESTEAAIIASDNIPFGHMGRTQGFAGATSGGSVVVMAAAQDLRGGMTFDLASSSLVLPKSGLYRVTVRPYISGGASYAASGKAQRNLADISGSVTQAWKADSADYVWCSSVTKPMNAGDKINLIVGSAGGVGSYWGTDGYNGASLEVEFVAPL